MHGCQDPGTVDTVLYVTVRRELLVGEVEEAVAVNARLHQAVGVLAEAWVHFRKPVGHVVGVTCGVVGVGLQHAQVSEEPDGHGRVVGERVNWKHN